MGPRGPQACSTSTPYSPDSRPSRGETLLDARAPVLRALGGRVVSFSGTRRGIQKAARVTETNENRCFSALAVLCPSRKYSLTTRARVGRAKCGFMERG